MGKILVTVRNKMGVRWGKKGEGGGVRGKGRGNNLESLCLYKLFEVVK